MPKGAIHVHAVVLTHYMTGKYVLDFHRDDIFWCTADPGWVTGTSYGIIAPLTHGVTNILRRDLSTASRSGGLRQNHRATLGGEWHARHPSDPDGKSGSEPSGY